MTHHVYTFWRDTEPLYAGCTGNLPQRMKTHRSSAWSQRATHISIVPIKGAAEAFAAEAALIHDLRPFYNTRHNPARMPLDTYGPDDTDRVLTIRERKRLALRTLARLAAQRAEKASA